MTLFTLVVPVMKVGAIVSFAIGVIFFTLVILALMKHYQRNLRSMDKIKYTNLIRAWLKMGAVCLLLSISQSVIYTTLLSHHVK